jgi:hypothetical protein
MDNHPFRLDAHVILPDHCFGMTGTVTSNGYDFVWFLITYHPYGAHEHHLRKESGHAAPRVHGTVLPVVGWGGVKPISTVQCTEQEMQGS